MTRINMLLAAVIGCAVIATGVQSLSAQNSPNLRSLHRHPSDTFENAANKWQLEAVDSVSQIDPVSAAVRAKRNTYWAAPLQTIFNASAAPGSYVITEGSYLGDSPEFPDVKGAAWVIATFKTFHVFALDSANRLIYTEINFRVDRVFRQPADVSLSAGNIIDEGLPGGRLRSSSGTTTTLAVSPHEYFWQPGHKYLLQLSYDRETDYFIPLKRWDLTSGRVQADQPDEADRAARGESIINGMSVDSLIRSLPSVLPNEAAK